MPPIVEKCLVQVQALQASVRGRATPRHVALELLEHLSLCEAHLLDVIGETSPSVARQSLVDALAECIRARSLVRHLGVERPACEARFLILQGLLQPYVCSDSRSEHGEHQVGRKLIWRDSPAAPATELEILSWEPGVGEIPGYYVTINEHRQRRLVRLVDFQTVEHVSAAWAPCENVTDSSEEDA